MSTNFLLNNKLDALIIGESLQSFQHAMRWHSEYLKTKILNKIKSK